MSTRIFQNSETNQIIEVEDSSIQRKYNVYGYFKKNEYFKENLKEYRQEREDVFGEFKEENPSLSDIKEFLSDFQEEYYYYTQDGEENGRPSLYNIYEEDDSWKNFDFIGGVFFDEYFEEIEEEDLCCFYEYEEYWDGSNFEEEILKTEEFPCSWEEVTEEFPEWDNKEFILTNQGQQGHDSYYKIGEDFFLEEVSYWQGSRTTWSLLEEPELAEALLSNPELREKIDNAEALLNDYFSNDLKNGEIIKIEDQDVIFEYKGEQYHFEESEIKPYGYGWAEEGSCETARKAIQERRKEKYTQILSEKFETLPLNRIFVQFSDSTQAGNCRKETREVQEQIAKSLNITSDFAFRADQLLNFRNDNLAKRAIIRAYINHYKS